MLSRLGQSSIFAGGRSLYETLRQQDDDEDSDNPDDLEAGVGMSAAHQDEELEGPNDYELRPPRDLTASQYSQTETRQSLFGSGPRSRSGGSSRLNYMSAQLPELDTEAEEVPASLLVERTGPGIREPYRDNIRGAKLPAHSTVRQGGPVRSTGHAHWVDPEPLRRRGEQVGTQEEVHQARMGLIDPKQRALWKWANVASLDNFLHDVWRYFHSTRDWGADISLLGVSVLCWQWHLQHMSSSLSEYDVRQQSMTTRCWRVNCVIGHRLLSLGLPSSFSTA